MTQRAGYTLNELMITIAIIATVFTAVVVVTLNPVGEFGEARDKVRKSDLEAILGAVYLYSIENNGRIPDSIPTIVSAQICRYGYGTTCEEAGVQSGISLDMLVSSGYLVGIPEDPQMAATSSGTLYEIVYFGGLVTITAQTNEGPDIITASL